MYEHGCTPHSRRPPQLGQRQERTSLHRPCKPHDRTAGPDDDGIRPCFFMEYPAKTRCSQRTTSQLHDMPALSSKTAAPILPTRATEPGVHHTKRANTVHPRASAQSITPCASPGLCSSTSSGPPAARRAAGGRRPPAGSTCAAGSPPPARSSPWPQRRRRAERSGARAHLGLGLGLGFRLGLGLG